MEHASGRTSAGPPGRFHDPGDRLEAFLDEVLVRCPRCAELARVTPTPGDNGSARPDWLADRRLVCAACALVRTWPAPGARRTCVTGTDVDPWFGEPLWLRADVAGHVLWAYNLRHLTLLQGYVGATLRTKDRTPGMIHTLLNRLPTWMKQARHRDELVAAFARLHASVPS
jgi:hypothetical protein